MDILFYRILLLMVGLAFLFIQSGDYQSFRIKVKVLPTFVDFTKWASFFSSFFSDNTQAYPSPLLTIDWEELNKLSEDSLSRLKAQLTQQNQSLVIVYPVFTQTWRDSPEQWSRYQDLPISYWELSAAGAFDDWHSSLLAERGIEFDWMLRQLKLDFWDTQVFAWGVFPQPSTSAQQFWNHLLAVQQENIDGYTLLIDKPDAAAFQYLINLKSTLSQPQSKAKSLGLRLQDKNLARRDELTSFVFLLKAVLGLPLAYLSYQKIPSQNTPISDDTLLARLFWRRPRMHSLEFAGGREGQLRHLQGWYWEKKWENGAILVNLGEEAQKIYTSDLFPSFFFQEIFSLSAEGMQDFSVSEKKGFHKVVLPAQSIAFLSTKPMLPYLPTTHAEESLSFELNLLSPQQLQMSYYLSEATKQLIMRVLDSNGQEIYAWQQQNAAKGYYELHHEVKHLPKGQYVCCIQTEHQNLLHNFEV